MDNETNQNSVNENTSTQETKVEMSQEALNALIDKKYAKGAEKAKTDLLESLGLDSVDSLKSMVEKTRQNEESQKTELQKMQERLEAIEAEKQSLAEKAEMANARATVSSMSAKHGIQDTEVFELIYNTTSKGEGFNEDEFITKLKESKPYLFASQAKATPRTDNSSNNQGNPLDFAQRVKMAKTKQELDALYAELK